MAGPGKPGRRRKPIDLKKLEYYASFCDNETEIAHALGISVSKLDKDKAANPEIVEAIARGKTKGHAKVKAKLMELIEQGNLGAIIFWLKCRAGYRETQKIETENVSEIKLSWQD